LEFQTYERSVGIQQIKIVFKVGGSIGHMGMVIVQLDALKSGNIAYDIIMGESEFTLFPDWYIETHTKSRGPNGMFGSSTTQRIVYVPRGLTQEDSDTVLYIMLKPLITTVALFQKSIM
jgi:hypothetical protein